MRRRGLFIAFVLVALALSVVWAAWPEPVFQASPTSFEQLRAGMEASAVEAVLGLPEDYFTSRGSPPVAVVRGDEHVIHLWFADDGRLLSKVIFYDEPFVRRVRRIVGF